MKLLTLRLQSFGRSPHSQRKPSCWLALATLAVLGLASCDRTSTATRSPAAPETSSQVALPLKVVAGENFWGSIAAQLGGDKVQVTSLIANPDTDPHDYEPKPADARAVADSRYAIANGAGYDPWLSKMLEANPVEGRQVLNIGELVGKKPGDNPHLWYNPDYVKRAIDQITADYKKLDPADAAYFEQAHTQFVTVELKEYNDTLRAIKQTYQGTPVGATESIFVYLAEPLGLRLLTPPKFMTAISEGEAPTAADKVLFDQQITQKSIKLLVINSQNSTPDTAALMQKAQTAGIAIVPVTETLTPATDSFQAWQTAQLKALQQALAKASGSR
jgi:zinc/manganese transport system substrate-binding protein